MTPPRTDVDALARRLPHRELSPDRSTALRHALLDAAGAPQARQTRAPVRRWMIGGGLAIAAAACAVLVLRASAPAPHDPPRVSAGSVDPATPGLPRAPAQASAPGPGQATEPSPRGAPGDSLPDGVSAIHASRPLQLARGGTRITAPPGAQFDVDVRGGEVRRLTVRSGWVVVAGTGTAATMVIERETWFPSGAPDAAPAAPPGSTPPTAVATPPGPAPAASPRTASPASVPAAGPATAQPRPPLTASRSPSDPATAPDRAAPPASAAPEPSPLDAAAQQAAAAEQAFHDGLKSLLAGQARAATGPLDRACSSPSTSQDDICYWAATAWLRAGDRDRARQALSDVLARWPRSTHAGEASVALGWLLLDAGDRAAARARFAAAVDDRMPDVRAEATRGLATAQ